jgi:hypothetical protein
VCNASYLLMLTVFGNQVLMMELKVIYKNLLVAMMCCHDFLVTFPALFDFLQT